ncbi:DUF1593-domain-containing protein, partial [Melanomma pulvis-pyrius CBS 109.77]
RDRIFILTDIANEPDDTMSLIRLLTHSDLYQVEGLVAITSFWLPNVTYPEHIQTLVDAYGTVYDNLKSHSNYTFPTAEYLTSKVASGPKTYGMQALRALDNGGNLTSGTQLLIETVDASAEPLYIQAWGGSNTLATALWHINRTRSAEDLHDFTSKIRVYSISDQDDTGPWIRYNFPAMRYVATRAGFSQYSPAAWTGISSGGSDPGGPNSTIVSQAWLTENIQIGPLGKLYPDVLYIMEGDTPALLFNIQNGLGNAAHPSWGGWGGRYSSNPGNTDAQYADAVDAVVGENGKSYNTNHATIWRWREFFQLEFAARMQWTLAPNSPDSNATHPPIVIVNESCGSEVVELDVNVGDSIVLDASASWSPDAKANLNFTWFQYVEPSSITPGVVPRLNITHVAGLEGRAVEIEIPKPALGYCVHSKEVTQFGQWGEAEKCLTLHIVVSVKDIEREYAITRYRRVLL